MITVNKLIWALTDSNATWRKAKNNDTHPHWNHSAVNKYVIHDLFIHFAFLAHFFSCSNTDIVMHPVDRAAMSVSCFRKWEKRSRGNTLQPCYECWHCTAGPPEGTVRLFCWIWRGHKQEADWEASERVNKCLLMKICLLLCTSKKERKKRQF